MTNQTIVLNNHQTIHGATIANLTYRGFWVYGIYAGIVVRTYEGWDSWEVVR